MIIDGNDPNGLGIFSRAGRDYTEKIPILSRRKPEHLKRPFARDSSPPIDRSSTVQPGKLMFKVEPFEKMVSREKRQKVMDGVNQNPVVGQYRPIHMDKPILVWDFMQSYKRQQENRQLLKARNKRRNFTLFSQTSDCSNFQQTSQKSTGHIDMSKMLGREDPLIKSHILTSTFSTLDNPQHFITEIRPHLKGSVSFTKQLSREKANRKKTDPGLTYDCKFEFVKRRLGGPVLSFDKRCGRKPMTNKTYTVAGASYDYDEYVWRGNSHVFPKTKVGLVDFRKQIKRRQFVEVEDQPSQNYEE